ncbi:glycosyltransferase [Hydrogenophaga sp.]|uniref:glycosyltransferase family 2 protein n=1 Tax=Hydrogenophaga sp. TaxID=1904254 RepID=UPI0027280F1C|nr:glycosyltransferase [Hydrogenophaga sp.]MDO8903917.1 glycosyltransferase [Hydrogenophaga sp.]
MWILGLRHGWRLLPGEVARRGGWYPQACEWWREFRAYGWGYFRHLANYENNPGPGSGANDRNDYAAWFEQRRKHAPTDSPPSFDRAGPLLSVVLPVYRPPLHLLKEAIDSVMSQSYSNWELCIADDASNDESLTAYLEDLRKQHTNIRIHLRERNGHISACSNSALALASGEFIVLLDQDDLIPPHALERVVACIQEHPDAGIIFSDEDRIDESGSRRLGAYFKPDFNYDLFIGHNLISHLGVYRRSLVTDVGGFREGLEGSQDWDLALRILEKIQPSQVVHIPEVLYHWRAIQGSTALAQSEKTYTSTAARKAMEDHLERMGVAGEVLASTYLPAFNRVRYAWRPESRTATILVSFDYPADQLRSMLTDLIACAGDVTCDIVVASSRGLSTDQLQPTDAREPLRIQVVPVPASASPAQRLNAMMAHAKGHFVAILTMPLIKASEAWLEELARIAGQPRVGFAAPRVVDGAGLKDIFDHGGILFTDDMRAVHAHKGLFTYMTGYAGRAILQQSFTAVSPALVVARRELLSGPAPFGTAFGGRLDLVDKSLALHHQGLANVWTPEVEIRFNDLRFAGRANLLTELGPFGTRRRAWEAKWTRRLPDPAYNRNLSPDGDFSLNWRLQ